MVRVVKERFQEMYKKRNYSERKLGLELEALKKQGVSGGIAYRSLQRCLQLGEMKYETLELCAEILQCRIGYLRGSFDSSSIMNENSISEFVSYHQKLGREFDDDGNLIGSFEEEIWQKSSVYFKWFMLSVMPLLKFSADIDGNGKEEEYTYVDVLQQENDYSSYMSPYLKMYVTKGEKEEQVHNTKPPYDEITEDVLNKRLYGAEMDFFIKAFTADLKKRFVEQHKAFEKAKAMTKEELEQYGEENAIFMDSNELIRLLLEFEEDKEESDNDKEDR